MEKCKHFNVCNREVTESNPEAGYCILHSPDPQKPVPEFVNTFHAHISERGNDFRYFVFPSRFSFRKGESGKIEITTAPFPEGSLDWEGPWLMVSNESGSSDVQRGFDDETEEPIFSDGADFSESVFLEDIEFTGCVFNKPGCIAGANFKASTFVKGAKFRWCRFPKGADFSGTSFQSDADFTGCQFEGLAEFRQSKIANQAVFSKAKFSGVYFFKVEFQGPADFSGATFVSGAASFNAAKFGQGANFREALFKVPKADFSNSSFRAISVFTARVARSSKEETIRVFDEVETDFRNAEVMPPDALHFQGADFRRCQFLGTDLRRAGLLDVLWPVLPFKAARRQGLYDETILIELRKTKKVVRSDLTGGIEAAYRKLKQNYEEQRDFERAGHFHYGEKEMRRLNPATPFGYQALLSLYRVTSGYGERVWRPFFWVSVLVLCTSFLYIWPEPSLRWAKEGSLVGFKDFLECAFFGVRVMFLTRPADFDTIGIMGKGIHFLQMILGPLFLGLLALAIRQRLRR